MASTTGYSMGVKEKAPPPLPPMTCATEFKPRTYITKSKAGHYTVTVKCQASRVSVSSDIWFSCLEHAQAAVPDLIVKLQDEIKTRKAKYGV